jgi:N-acetylglucosamine malate deacetylase 1
MSKRVLSFGAHPDDIELGCGGTEAKLAGKGYEITHVYLTSGDAGSQTVPGDELARIREKEAIAAAGTLGVSGVEFLRYRDGLTGFTREMKIEIIRLIRARKPHIIFVHERNETSDDHKITSDLVLSAIGGAAGPWFQEAGEGTWSPETILGYEVWHPLGRYELAVDISGTLERKIQSLLCYKSQIKDIWYDEAFRSLARYRGVMSLVGSEAEVFEVIKASDLF